MHEDWFSIHTAEGRSLSSGLASPQRFPQNFVARYGQ